MENQSVQNCRVVISGVTPQIEGGAYPIKRIVNQSVEVEADIFTDGHDIITAFLIFGKSHDGPWEKSPMVQLGNDRWRGSFKPESQVPHFYTVRAWVNPFLTWKRGARKKFNAGQDIGLELQSGRAILSQIQERADRKDASLLGEILEVLGNKPVEQALALLEEPRVSELAALYPDHSKVGEYEKILRADVDRKRALFSSWYEFFPRSCGSEGSHGTFRNCEERLEYVSGMGFDVVYLPPIHPIGFSHRKGLNNSVTCEEGDPGSPWAIGSADGGHKEIHPELGTLADFNQLVKKAEKLGMEIAMDIAFQCSPDHPYVNEHPEWFRKRPDGSIQYAENPPKKYEDIVPFDFECGTWKELWEELKSIIFFWADKGIRIFRVDNPHTKPFPFWEWVISQVKSVYPDAIFLAEAFTRPRVMERLAMIGFTQSYTYFTWRNSKWELEQYITELTTLPIREYMRPNFWPNTPDILHEFLQNGGRPGFIIRLVLAATLSSNYGIYGPLFELCKSEPYPGREEYINSEKYEIGNWDLNNPVSIRPLIRLINKIRRENPALQQTVNTRLCEAENEMILFYRKYDSDSGNDLFIVVNLDPFHFQAGWVKVPIWDMDLSPDETYHMRDLIGGAAYTWQGERNYVGLDPGIMPAHIFHLTRNISKKNIINNST